MGSINIGFRPSSLDLVDGTRAAICGESVTGEDKIISYDLQTRRELNSVNYAHAFRLAEVKIGDKAELAVSQVPVRWFSFNICQKLNSCHVLNKYSYAHSLALPKTELFII